MATLGDGKIGRKQQPFRIGDSSADEVFIAGHAGKLLEQPGKMILAEARPGRQLFNAQIFRAVVIDIGTDGHEFFYIFLLFAGEMSGNLFPSAISLRPRATKTKKQGIDAGLPIRILTGVFLFDFFQILTESFCQPILSTGPDKAVRAERVQEGIHACQAAKQGVSQTA